MNRLAISEMKLIFRSGFPYKKYTGFENFMNFSKTTDKKPIDEPNKKKDSKPVYITLLGTGGIPTISTLESALKLSKRRNLRLVKVSEYDSIRQTSVYKFVTGAEILGEDLEIKKNKKGTGFKSEKILSLSDGISSHDLVSKCKQISKWLEKKHAVRVTITGSLTGSKAEVVFKQIEEKVKTHGKIVQKRLNGNDIKFQLIPFKETKSDKENGKI